MGFFVLQIVSIIEEIKKLREKTVYTTCKRE